MFRLVLFYTISFHYYSNRCFTDEVQSSHILTPSPFIIHHVWPFIPHLYLHLYSHPPSPIPLTLPSPLTFTLTLETPINRAFQTESEGVRVRKEKNYFYYIAIWMEKIHRQRLWGYSYHCRKLHRAICNKEYLTWIMGDTMTRSEETSGIKELEKFHSLMNRKRRASGGTL